MVDVALRTAEACSPDPYLLWDSEWNADKGFADWALAGADEPLNRGGLQAKQGLVTAIVLALFTDARVPRGHQLAYLADEDDNRGWWGDAVDVRTDQKEQPLGSLLWLLERAPLTVRGVSITIWAEQFVREALAPLQAQGAVAGVSVTASTDAVAGRLDLDIRLTSPRGGLLLARKFSLLWRQVA